MMTVPCTRIATILIVATLLTTHQSPLTTPCAAADKADDGKLLQGTWLPTAAELGEKPLDEETVKSIKLVIDGDKYTVTVGKAIDKGSTKIDPAAKPKTLDIMGTDGPNKGKTLLAIYELDGDTLRICYDLSGKARPTEFKTKKGEQLFLVTYKRSK
jgi:uncharacterized protein (TIGR03067 family)